MAEPKAKTMQERLGFLDPDLKKPQHDEIMKWVDANIEDILMVVFGLAYRPKTRTVWEVVVRAPSFRGPGMVVGFADLVATWLALDRVGGEEGRSCIIEVKTEIPSLGELIRQIRMYQAGILDRRCSYREDWLVISPDDSHAETLRSQGILFFKYDPSQTFAELGGV